MVLGNPYSTSNLLKFLTYIYVNKTKMIGHITGHERPSKHHWMHALWQGRPQRERVLVKAP